MMPNPTGHELPLRRTLFTASASQQAEIGRLRGELDDLRDRLADSEETLRAIRHGEVDALLVTAVAGDERVFTLSTADRPYHNFVEHMADGAAIVSCDGTVLYTNQALADLMESSRQQLVGRNVSQLVTATSRDSLTELIGPTSTGGSVEATLKAVGGALMPVRVRSSSSLKVNGDNIACVTVTDLTQQRRADAELTHSAQHDALTGLLNRTLLTDRIQHALDRRSDGKGLIALLFCDVDGLKNVNDAYGHQAGDDLLCSVAERLTSVVREEDTVARIGGDEFVVLCEGLGDIGDVTAVAARVSAAVAAPRLGQFDQVTVSIGVSVTSDGDDASPDSLLRDADEAMYKAKHQGPNTIALFDEHLRTVTTSRLRLLSEMRHAVVGAELRLHYQPVLALADEIVIGVEALIRWQHPSRGLVPPDQFIPFAERSGLITGIGAWVLDEACRQASVWSAAEGGGRQLDMSVNISGRQLAQGAGLVQSVRRALEESGVDPTALVLEVTESALMDDAEAALRVLSELKSLGVRIAIDDFGTGYSSLVYLKRFPVDLLKVDRCFVAGLGTDNDDEAIVHSVIQLARAFGIAAVAEGIETRQHLTILQELGCTYGQGYLWGRACPPADLRHALFPAVVPSVDRA